MLLPVSSSAPRHELSRAPLFPPLLPGVQKRPRHRPMVVHCPTRLRGLRSMRDGVNFSKDGGSVSVGHGPGSAGNEGTADDRGTSSPGSNLTGNDHVPAPKDAPPKRQDKDNAGDQPLLNDKPKH